MTEEVELSASEIRVLQALTDHLPVSRAGLPIESLEEMMRRVARQEIASLAGLMLRPSGTWGEALSDFSGHTKAGDEPG